MGRQLCVTQHSTVVLVWDLLLWCMFSQQQLGKLPQDSKGHFFLNCHGFLFCYILEPLKNKCMGRQRVSVNSVTLCYLKVAHPWLRGRIYCPNV